MMTKPKSIMTKILSVLAILIVVLGVLHVTPVHARQPSQDEIDAMSRELDTLSSAKSAVGLSGVDFEQLEAGDAVPICRFTNDCEVVQCLTYLPLIYEGRYVAGFLEDERGELFYQTGFAELLQEYCEKYNPEQLGFVYTAKGLCVTDGVKTTLVVQKESDALSQASLSSGVPSTNQLKLVGLADVRGRTPLRLAYISSFSPTTVVTTDMVRFITQRPNTQLCWAASISMLYCCHTGVYNTAENMAYILTGYHNYNGTAGWDSIASYLKYSLNLGNYGFTSDAPSFDTVEDYIQAGYPIIGKMNYYNSSGYLTTNISHAVVIFGCVSNDDMILHNPWNETYGLTIAKKYFNQTYNTDIWYYVDPDASSGTQYAVLTGHIKYETNN